MSRRVTFVPWVVACLFVIVPYRAYCAADELDQVGTDAANQRINKEAEEFARTHPLVLARAGGAIKSISVGASLRSRDAPLQTRLTVMVTPDTGKMFFAEVDAQWIDADGKLVALTTTLACITDLWIGQRGAYWKDVCLDDPNATKP
jgi:hypothetical protein